MSIHIPLIRSIFAVIICTGFLGCATHAKKATCRVNNSSISDHYDGECVSGLAHGKGTAVGSYGHSYSGDFSHGDRHGEGTYMNILFTNSGNILTIFETKKGKWANDKFVEGESNGPDGFPSHKGKFKNGLLTGLGIIKYADGKTEEGDFLSGELNGFGTIKNKTAIIEQGLFSQGKLKISCADAEICKFKVDALKELLVSGQPEDVYLTGVKFETEMDHNEAITYYKNVISRFPKTPVAIKAADRLLAIQDKATAAAAMLLLKEAADGAQREARNQEKSAAMAKQTCRSARQACISSCGKKDWSCQSSCGYCD